MVGEALAGLSAFKTMLDMAKALKDINDATIRNGAVIELQKEIIGAYEAQTALLEKVRALEAQVAKTEAWETEKQRYQLQEFPPGVFLYVLKPDMANGEPAHRICPKCYGVGQKHLLHSDEPSEGITTFFCYGCGAKYHVGIHQPRQINYPDRAIY